MGWFSKDKQPAADAKPKLSCSFCRKSQAEVRKLIAGPTVYICDECISLCNDIINEELDKDENTVPQDAEVNRRTVCASAAHRLARMLAFVPDAQPLVQRVEAVAKELEKGVAIKAT